MKIFKRGAQRIRMDFATKCINSDLITLISQNLYETIKRETIGYGTPTKAMWSKINSYLDKTKNRMFLVKKDAPTSSTSFRTLIDHQLLHEISSIVLPRWVRKDHKAYFIDYGNYISWSKGRNRPIEQMLSDFIFPNWENYNSADVPDLLLDITPDIDKYITCEHCQFSNDRELAIVKKFNACMNCAESIKLEHTIGF